MNCMVLGSQGKCGFVCKTVYAKESYGSLQTVSLLIEIYLPLNFQVDTCYTCSCCVMLRTQLSVKNSKGQ